MTCLVCLKRGDHFQSQCAKLGTDLTHIAFSNLEQILKAAIVIFQAGRCDQREHAKIPSAILMCFE